MGKISFVIPCYNSSGTLAGVVDEIKSALSNLQCDDYEIILVCDGSPDNTFEIITLLCGTDKRIKGINLAKNFGQQSALMAGIRHSAGDVLVFLDDDGQTPASEVGKLLEALDDNCDVVIAKYNNKRHALWRNIGSGINDYMAETLIGKPKDLSLTSYCAFKRFVADELKNYDGKYPYMGGLLLRSTNRIKNVSVTHRERASGHSGYTLSKLIMLWLNGFTAFSVKPLRIATIMGFLTAAAGFIYLAYVIVHKLINPGVMLGYSSIMATLLCIGGMLMVMLGLIGEYVGRIYISINKSPQYVIRERIGFENGNNGSGYEYR